MRARRQPVQVREDGRGISPRVFAHLNRLTARAHAVVYVAAARSGWSRVRDFRAARFPREVRRSWAPIVFCTAITVIAALVAYASVCADPQNAHALVPEAPTGPIDKPLHESNFGFDCAFSPAMASYIITNNVKVAAIAFAGGMTGGLLTGWIILTNGLMLGALGALYVKAGFGADFWATIAPHGVIELSAIQIAGGAGLLDRGRRSASRPLPSPRCADRGGPARRDAGARGRAAALRRGHHRGIRLAAAAADPGARGGRRAHRGRARRVPALRRTRARTADRAT